MQFSRHINSDDLNHTSIAPKGRGGGRQRISWPFWHLVGSGPAVTSWSMEQVKADYPATWQFGGEDSCNVTYSDEACRFG